MKLTQNELRALHTEACATVLKTDRCVTPADDGFWPLYIQALLDNRTLLADCGTVAELTVAERAVISERRRQVDAEGFAIEHDDEHEAGVLASAAVAYALAAADALHPFSQGDGGYHTSSPPDMWPWEPAWWKPSTPRRSLEKAAALLLAELDRLLRVPGDESIHGRHC
ncbi:hypothetical protein PQQ81_01015 [Paraburkholderia strydomiana]|uniref:hypothetical protein n=1 Tax=Paraburkholderia strydomiana TaxID=1245417 RepID=UPI0038B98F48